MNKKIYKKNIIAYTDGSFKKKRIGKKIYEIAGYGVYFPNNELKNIGRPLCIDDNKIKITNNRAELYAIYQCIKRVIKYFTFDELNIYTDSQYSIKSLTLWTPKWIKNNWKNSSNKDVLNKDLIKKIYKILQKYDSIKLHWVKGHSKNIHNEHADRLANKGADRYYHMYY
jgi:ribonuclease HI